MGFTIYTFSIASFAVLGLLLGAFAPQIRNVIEPLARALGGLFQATEELASRTRIAIWDAVKPRQPVDPLRALLGLALLGGAVTVVVANFHQLVPTVAFLIPVAGAQTALALAIVVMGTALGALLHAIPERRRVFLGVCLLLVACVGVLNWKRAELILDGPDLGALLLATLFPVLLQVAELATVFGALHLAGCVLPLFAAAPALLCGGIISTVARLLVRAKLDEVVEALVNAATDAGERLFHACRRLAGWLSPAAFAERRQAKRVRRLKEEAEIHDSQTAIDLERQHLRSTRDAEEHLLRADAAHQRDLHELRRKLEIESAEADLRAEIASESEIFAGARARKMAAIATVVQRYYDTAERIALEVIDETQADIKANAMSQVKIAAPESAMGIAAAAREVFRAAGSFNSRGTSSRNHVANHSDSHKDTVN